MYARRRGWLDRAAGYRAMGLGMLAMAGVLWASGSAAAQQVDRPPNSQIPEVEVFVSDGGGPKADSNAAAAGQATVKVFVGGEGQKGSDEYWIGVECAPVDEVLRAQLNLKEGQGLVVHGVAPESPAKQAGLEPFDILLSAGDKPLGQVRQLQEVVSAAGDKEISLELLRGGKRKTVKITPVARPRDQQFFQDLLTLPEGDHRMLEQWIQRLRPDQKRLPPLGLQFFHPGVVLPPGTELGLELPDGVEITISKRGDEPVKIHVRRGDESWDVTEESFSELPQDLREPIKQMFGRITLWSLGPGAAGIRARAFLRSEDRAHDEARDEQKNEARDEQKDEAKAGAGALFPRFDARPNLPRREGIEPRDDIDKRLDDLNRQLQELRETIEKHHRQKQGNDGA